MDEPVRKTIGNTEYEYLRGTGLFSSARSFLGRDHLLSASQFFATETYRRFFFKDIQAILVRPTHWGYVTMVSYGLMTLFFLVLFLTAFRTLGSSWGVFVAIMVLYALVMTVRSILRGPTCNVTIKTSLQTERVPAFRFLKSTEESLAIVMERIAGAQGTLEAGEILEHQDRERTAFSTRHAPTEPSTEWRADEGDAVGSDESEPPIATESTK